MQNMNFIDSIEAQAFVMMTNDTITEVSQSFVDMTEYLIEELINKNIEEVLKTLKVGPNVNFKNLHKQANYFLFTKHLEVRFVNIEVRKKFNQRILILREKENSRFENNNQFLERLISENKTGIGIFKASNFILLKANQSYLNDFPEPYNNKEMLYGKSLKDVIPNFKDTDIEKAFSDVVTNNQPTYYKEQLSPVSNGINKYWNYTLMPICVNSQVEYIVVMIDDVTESVISRERIRKQAELIEQRNKQLEAIFESIDDAIFIIDSDKNYYMTNKSAKEYYPNSDMNRPDDVYNTYKYYDFNGNEISIEDITASKLFRGEVVINDMMTLRNEEITKHISVNGRPIYDSNGNIKFVVMCSRDITQSVESQKTIMRQKGKLEAIIESIGDILLIVDKDGDAYKQDTIDISSYYKSTNNNVLDFNNNSLSLKELPIHKVLEKGKKVKNFKMKIIEDEREIYTLVNGTPIFNSNGEVKLGVFATLDITELIEKENQIKKQKELLENIIKNTSNGIFIFNKEGKQLIMNEAAKQLVYPADSLNTLEDIYSIAEYFYEDGSVVTKEEMPAYRALKGETVNGERIIVKQPHREMVFEFKSSPIYDSNGNIDMIITSNHDITELINQNKIIKQQKELLESIIKNVSDAIIVYDKDMNVILQNEAAKKILHDPENFKKYGDTLKTTKCFDIYGNEIFADSLPVFKSFKGEKVTNFISTFETPDITLHCRISSTPIFDEYGNVNNVVACMHNITDLIKQEEQIKEHKEQLEAIINNMQESILVFDKNGKYIIKNRITTELLKTTFETIDDLYKVTKFFNVDGSEVFPDEMPFYHVKRGESIKGKVVYFEVDGRKEYIIINAVPTFDSKGDFLYGIVSSLVITEIMESEQNLKLAQEQLLKVEREKNETLEKALEMKDEFLSLISHEFRTPINVISTAIQALNYIYGNELSDKVKEYLGTIRQNTFRQLRLVNNLLDITRANAGRIKINKKNIDIVFITKAITESVYDYAAQKGVRVSLNSSFKEKIIGIDDEKYERIILNLISNAIKFTSEGESILVTLRSVKGNICVEVKDNGIGIPPDKIDIIFDKFGQVDSSLSRQAEGTGIGLSLVKMFVKALGGSISVKSKVGKGSTFTVLFPNEKVAEEENVLKMEELMNNRLIEVTNVEFSDVYL